MSKLNQVQLELLSGINLDKLTADEKADVIDKSYEYHDRIFDYTASNLDSLSNFELANFYKTAQGKRDYAERKNLGFNSALETALLELRINQCNIVIGRIEEAILRKDMSNGRLTMAQEIARFVNTYSK